ncbi:hypothetical protein [Hymenobacter sp. BRD67]|uniref:hypothetical protein n=1 Tax=Hymenobacter sp. BRD67 TaxID=2675877 RepID=UPI0015672D7B|nr:hypothetical protein [Hymenobacter sp. BRD67]QKG53277.1 hypothetical protein GKZ67_12615 [Hymenobacter sp. BRD67]
MKSELMHVSSAETGQLGVQHLKRFWAQSLARREGIGSALTEQEWRFDNLLLNGLDLALQETKRYLMHIQPTFTEFEQWVLAKNGGDLAPLRIERLNSVFANQPYGENVLAHLRELEAYDDVLSADDLQFWEENGYVIVREAISREQAQATEDAVWEALDMRPDTPASWYEKPIGQGIMMDFYHHPTLRANRESRRIRKAFAQLWGTPTCGPPPTAPASTRPKRPLIATRARRCTGT